MLRVSCVAALPCVRPMIVHAQGSVTLYGLTDEGVSNEARHSSWLIPSGGGSLSRWGLQGTEDPGAGYKAVFSLENGLDLGSGSSSDIGRLLGRKQWPDSSPASPRRRPGALTRS